MSDGQLSETEFLRRLRGELGKVYHDISNPLAIVSGNLELVNELQKVGAPLEEITESLVDAHAAVAGFKDPMQHLLEVRAIVDKRLAQSVE